MNVILWVLQILLALHTAAGALWKFVNPEGAVPSLKAVPHGVWIGLSVVEILCVVALIAPAIDRRWGSLATAAATFIVAEMLFYTGVFFATGASALGQVAYWLVVAAICAFIVYGRTALAPIR